MLPDAIDKLPFYRVEYILHFHKEYTKREREENENKKQSVNNNQNIMKDAMNHQKKMMVGNKIPGMGKIPKFPKI